MKAPEDRPVPWRAVGGISGPALGILAVFAIVSAQPDLVETLFARRFGRWAEWLLGTLTGWIPISLAEWIEGGIGLAVIVALAQAARHWWTGRRSFGNLASNGLARLVLLGLLGLIGFYASWGLNYARAPLLERLDLDAPDPDHPLAITELILLADDLIDRTNAAYLLTHGVPDAGEMTVAPPRHDLDASIEEGWARAVDNLGWDPSLARRRPQPKPLLSSAVFSRLGISGFYFPFTSEANYNTWTPGWQLPLTIAHEKAHQRGFASENEANFAGFIACIHSTDPHVRYSGLIFAQRQLLFALLEADEWTAVQLIERRLPGVQRDVTEGKAFWRQFEGNAREVSRVVNDAYLRANRVRGGIDSYNQSTELVIAWARSRDLEVDPELEPR